MEFGSVMEYLVFFSSTVIESFAGHSSLGWHPWSLNVCIKLDQDFLTFIVSIEKSGVILLGLPLYVKNIWNIQICVSSLHRAHANLLYIVPILAYVLLKRAFKSSFNGGVFSVRVECAVVWLKYHFTLLDWCSVLS